MHPNLDAPRRWPGLCLWRLSIQALERTYQKIRYVETSRARDTRRSPFCGLRTAIGLCRRNPSPQWWPARWPVPHAAQPQRSTGGQARRQGHNDSLTPSDLRPSLRGLQICGGLEVPCKPAGAWSDLKSRQGLAQQLVDESKTGALPVLAGQQLGARVKPTRRSFWPSSWHRARGCGFNLLT